VPSGIALARLGQPGGQYGGRAMCLAAGLMPGAAGRRWLAEAENFLAEASPILRRGAIRSYLTGAFQVIAVSWASELSQRARLARRGPTAR
jgi:hypothetical protein